MKKILLGLMAIIMCTGNALAEEKSALAIHVSSSDTQSYNISSLPVMKHVDGQLVMKVNGGELGKYEIYDGLKITFSKEADLGDVNQDSKTTMADANSIVNKFLSGYVTNINVTAADYNKDGQITMADANSVTNSYLVSGE